MTVAELKDGHREMVRLAEYYESEAESGWMVTENRRTAAAYRRYAKELEAEIAEGSEVIK